MVKDQAKAMGKIRSWQVKWYIDFQPKIARNQQAWESAYQRYNHVMWQDEYRISPSAFNMKTTNLNSSFIVMGTF